MFEVVTVGSGWSGEMTGGGAVLLTHPMIMLGFIPGKPPFSIDIVLFFFLLLLQVRLLHFHDSAHISVCIATLSILHVGTCV